MAARRAGLGRGLDGMFTSYLDTNKEEEQKKKRKTAPKKASETKKAEIVPKKNVNEPPESEKKEEIHKNTVMTVRLIEVEPNREQPRKEFQEEALAELAESIRQYGVIQPLLVQKRENYYEIIAGERRWRAAKLAGLKEIPVIVKDYSDQEIVEVSLIENIQREDLNPIEEALAYQRLLEEFDLRQEDIAQRVSKNRSTITNSLRLLKLDERVRTLLVGGEISGGHARTLLGIEEGEKQYEIAKKIIRDKLSVRDLERLIRGLHRENVQKKEVLEKDGARELIRLNMEEQMKAALGTKVTVHQKNGKSGRIEIDYYSTEELERIFDLLKLAGKGGSAG